MSGPQPALAVEGLDAFYGAAQILFQVSLEVPAGAVVALVGRNGAGKSTTLKAILGEVAARGRIRLDGADVARRPVYERVALGLGYVPEDRRIFTDLTVMENLEVGRRPARAGREPFTPERLFALFPNLAEMRARRGRQMSGGEQQMLAIARTLMGNPSLLLLDEPSEGLAPRIVADLAAVLAQLKAEGLSILLSEQNVRFARHLADTVVVLEKGRVRFAGGLADFDAGPDGAAGYLGL